MKKRKTKTTRSPKQQWHSERKWECVGSLNGIVNRLCQIIKYPSTTQEERESLSAAVQRIRKTSIDMAGYLHDTESFILWKYRKGV
jgi:hypothetical protein